MSCVNRTLTGPISINNDHSDSIGVRDSGWIQLYGEDNQEAYDAEFEKITGRKHGLFEEYRLDDAVLSLRKRLPQH